MKIEILRTSKFHWEQYLFAPILQIIWEPFSGKQAHWWNWSSTEKNFQKALFVKGKKENKALKNTWDKIIQLNFKWHTLLILRPKNYTGEYQLAYESKKEKEICSIIVKGKIACLRSAEDTQYTGFSFPEGREIALELIEEKDKKVLEKGVLFL